MSTSLASTKRASSSRESKPEKSIQVQPGQGRAAGRQFVAVGVEELRAESLQDAGAAVGVGAAADAEDDLPATGVERRPDQFAGTQAGGALGAGGVRRGPAGAAGQDREAGRGSHLDDRFAAADRKLCPERLPSRAADQGAPAGEAGADGGIEGALAAVGHRNPEDVKIVAGCGLQPGIQVPGHVRCGQ